MIFLTRIYDFRNKEVINISTGQRLGFIEDVNLDIESGLVSSVIIPSNGKFFGMFGKDSEYVIPWKNIKKIGKDIVLVDYTFIPHTETKHKPKRL